MKLSKQELMALEDIVKRLDDFSSALKDLAYLEVYVDKEKAREITKLREIIKSRDSKKIKDFIKNYSQFLSEIENLADKTFSSLTAYQKFRLSRHPERPKSSDYIKAVFDDFTEFIGEGEIGPDPSLIGGIAKLGNKNVMVIGQEKGIIGYDAHYRDGGVVKPAGYRKSQRLMELAENLNLPLITFIDTPGANPIKENFAGQGIEAVINGKNVILEKEEKEIELQINDHPHTIKIKSEDLLTDIQGQTISKNIRKMGQLKVPTISVVIGEGGSGGAVAIGAADKLLMLSNSYFSVISPEGACGILKRFKDGNRVKLDPNNKEDLEYVSKNLRFSAQDCLDFKIADEIIKEPFYGAQNNPQAVYKAARESILKNLDSIQSMNRKEIIKKRLEKYRSVAKFSEGNEKKFSKKFRKEFSLLGDEKKWIVCPNSEKENCKDLHSRTLYLKYQGVCPNCDYHFRMPLEFYIDHILDNNSFQELDSGIKSINAINFEGFEQFLEEARNKAGTNSALIYGKAKIGGKDIIAVLSQNDFRGGSFASAESEKIVRAFSKAIECKEKGEIIPVVMFNRGGGIRIEEGPIGVAQMITSSQACSLLKYEEIPLISVLLDPTMAGILASYAGTADIVIAEKNAMIGFAGEDVIKKTIGETISKEFRYAEEAQKRGVVDLVVNRHDLKSQLEKIIKLYN